MCAKTSQSFPCLCDNSCDGLKSFHFPGGKRTLLSSPLLSHSFFLDLNDSSAASLAGSGETSKPGTKESLSFAPLADSGETSKSVRGESMCLSHAELIAAQKADMSLSSLFSLGSSDVDLDKEPQCFFFVMAY